MSRDASIGVSGIVDPDDVSSDDASESAASGRPSASTVLIWAFLIASFAFALWLRFYRLGDPIGGFHAFNEGFYARVSAIDVTRGAFDWVTSPVDLNNPPLYSLLVTWAFKLFAPSDMMARSVSALAGVVTVGLTGLLGSELWNRRAGVIAALVLALMPGAVIVSRNAQTDPLMVALALGALLAWVYSARGDGIGWAITSGVLLGLGLLTKLPAILVVPAMVTWDVMRTGGLSWLKTRRTAAAAIAALACVLPWYVVRFSSGAAEFMKWQTTTVSRTGVFLKGDFVRSMIVEPFWMLSVVAVAAVVLGLAVMARKRQAGDATVAVLLVSALVFLVFFHFHTYYWLVAAPALALVAGRGLGSAGETRWVRLVSALTVVVVVGMALSATMLLSGNKWGQWSAVALQSVAAQSPTGTSVIVSAGVWDNTMGPSMQLYLPESSVVRQGDVVTKGARRVVFIGSADGTDPAAVQMSQERIRPVLFGWALWQDPPNVNFFRNGPWSVQKVGPFWQVGLTVDQVGSRYAYTDVTAEVR